LSAQQRTVSTRTDKSTGYLTLVQQLKQFETIGELPISISSRVNYLSWNDLLERFVSNKAKFHKKCRNKYDKQHYDRASKKENYPLKAFRILFYHQAQ
jgi:hypothetical protein